MKKQKHSIRKLNSFVLIWLPIYMALFKLRALSCLMMPKRMVLWGRRKDCLQNWPARKTKWNFIKWYSGQYAKIAERLNSIVGWMLNLRYWKCSGYPAIEPPRPIFMKKLPEKKKKRWGAANEKNFSHHRFSRRIHFQPIIRQELRRRLPALIYNEKHVAFKFCGFGKIKSNCEKPWIGSQL